MDTSSRLKLGHVVLGPCRCVGVGTVTYSCEWTAVPAGNARKKVPAPFSNNAAAQDYMVLHPQMCWDAMKNYQHPGASSKELCVVSEGRERAIYTIPGSTTV